LKRPYFEIATTYWRERLLKVLVLSNQNFKVLRKYNILTKVILNYSNSYFSTIFKSANSFRHSTKKC
jgi:hypothetical protein